MNSSTGAKLSGRSEEEIKMNWEVIIRHYQINHRPNLQRQIDWFRRQPSFESVIKNACFAINEMVRTIPIKIE